MGYELEVYARSRIVSRRPLLNAVTVLGPKAGADVVLPDLEEQVVLHRDRTGVHVQNGAPTPHLWPPTEPLELSPYTLKLQHHVGYTVSHEQSTTGLTQGLEVRAGGAAVTLSTEHSTVIGRSKADLNLAHRSVQSRHAKVEWRGSAYYLTALSDAPLRSNGHLIDAGGRGVRLKLGDRLEVGAVPVEVQLARAYADHGLLGSSLEMEAVRRQLERLVDAEIVMIEGETGTGKTLAAHALHALKGRKGELLPLNGATLQPETSRAALFGHEKNAFSDAYEARKGAFGTAEGGTLLISQAGAIAREVQAQLLRVLQDLEVGRVGGAQSLRRKGDVHVILTVRPEELSSLRQDLVGRIALHKLSLPPLRDRGSDVVELAAKILDGVRPGATLTVAAQRKLRMHDWPGNVRELQNVIENSAHGLPSGAVELDAQDLELAVYEPQLPKAAPDSMTEMLLKHRGNVLQAAKAAGVSRGQFERRVEGEGHSVQAIREVCRARWKREVEAVVAEMGSYVAAAKELGLSAEGVRSIVGAQTTKITRVQLERLVQAEAGDLDAVALRLGVSTRTVQRHLDNLGAFQAGRPTLRAQVYVQRDAQAPVAHRVDDIGCAIGPGADCDVRIEEPKSPSQLALVVRAGDTLGLRVFGGPSVEVGGGRVLQARTVTVEPNEGVRVGKTRVWLETNQVLDGPTRESEAIAVKVGGERHVVDVNRGLTIGTDPSCDLVLEDPYVSAVHVRLCESGGDWHVIDRSKNGTFVGDDNRVHRGGPVRIPTKLGLGDIVLELEWAEPPKVPMRHGMVGSCPAMQKVFAQIDAAKDRRVVLVTGETGTGKELTARALHKVWGGGPFVAVNCGGVTDELLWHELVGHVRGAFTGAKEDQPGLVEQAAGGTLFLDEIGDMSLRLQAQVVELVEAGTYRPFGSDELRTADVRIVAATNRDLHAMVGEGTFSSALFYRFGMKIHLPPLRDRGQDDLRDLSASMVYQLSGRRWGDALGGADMNRRWERNIRELRGTLEAMAEGDSMG